MNLISLRDKQLLKTFMPVTQRLQGRLDGVGRIELHDELVRDKGRIVWTDWGWGRRFLQVGGVD